MDNSKWVAFGGPYSSNRILKPIVCITAFGWTNARTLEPSLKIEYEGIEIVTAWTGKFLNNPSIHHSKENKRSPIEDYWASMYQLTRVCTLVYIPMLAIGQFDINRCSCRNKMVSSDINRMREPLRVCVFHRLESCPTQQISTWDHFPGTENWKLKGRKNFGWLPSVSILSVIEKCTNVLLANRSVLLFRKRAPLLNSYFKVLTRFRVLDEHPTAMSVRS